MVISHQDSAQIEAGPKDISPWIRLPTGVQKAITDERTEWRLKTESEPHMKERAISIPRGKVLGGYSSMNGMVSLRRRPSQAQQRHHQAASGT
jgi:choline dehydrogenase